MTDLHRRWFDPQSIQADISSMLRKFGNVPRAQSVRVQNERDRLKARYVMIAAGGAVVFLVVVIGALLLFAPKPEKREANYGGLALLGLLLVGGAGAGTYFGCGNNNRKRAQRDEALEQLCGRHPGLRPARRTEIDDTSVGNVPWFHSEEWIHTYGLASGEYEGSRIIAVECTHVVDPILGTTDSRLMQGLAGLGSSKHKRLFLQAMDATIFVEPLPNVSDLLIVPKMEPSRAYYKRDLREQDCDLANAFRLPRALRRKYWMAAAEPEECGGLFATELPKLLANRKWCIVQVVGGHCAVITSHWHGNFPSRAPSTEEAIAENLAFAQAVYQELKRISTSGAVHSTAAAEDMLDSASGTTAVTASTTTSQATVGWVAEPSAVAVAVREPDPTFPPPTGYAGEPAAVAQTTAAASRPARRRRPHSLLAKICLLGLGVPMFLVGLPITIKYSVDWHRGLAAYDWPQADAQIIDSDVDVKDRAGGEDPQYEPRVSYEYEVDGRQFTGDRIQYGIRVSTADKHEVEQIVDKYPQGAVVKVHYDAERSDISVLEPGLRRESIRVGSTCVTGTFALLGLLMIGSAAVGKRATATP